MQAEGDENLEKASRTLGRTSGGLAQDLQALYRSVSYGYLSKKKKKKELECRGMGGREGKW